MIYNQIKREYGKTGTWAGLSFTVVDAAHAGIHFLKLGLSHTPQVKSCMPRGRRCRKLGSIGQPTQLSPPLSKTLVFWIFSSNLFVFFVREKALFI